ncbi:LysR family transcriptional regulator [Moraxella sp. FZFQ2102]|uniref:LysR family transcriptional regulator n=1 Tax=Moraxella sp. FZFQ2102 TaxID=2953752 RepID=UPI00209C53D6|nr:LysR family transcriptional regulator [Moraxella sp. FZFQ2102]USZ14368.1 LysR family transcriptional regulator [Moraxella sp. FZFQ2102]
MAHTLDIRLLQLFHAIYTHENISHAAASLDIGQPAASIGLSKLRKHFDNQLFVRVGHQMLPTEFAKELAPLITQTLEQVRLINDYRRAFDPAISTRTFTLGLTDISHLQLVPKLAAYLHTHAPHICLNVVPIDAATPTLMSSGQIDLAIGFIPQLEAGFYQQTLFHQHYVALVRHDHPRIAESLSLQDYERENHLEIVPSGTGHYMAENEIQRLGVTRNIRMRMPGYLGVDAVVKNTDLIATVPEKLGFLLDDAGCRIYPLPFELSGFDVKQHWHARMHKNSDNRWLRQVCFELFHQ